MKKLYVNFFVPQRPMTMCLVIALLFFLPSIAMAQEAQWARTIGSSDIDQITSIVHDDEGSVYIVGTFEGTVNFDPYDILNGDYRTSNGGGKMFLYKNTIPITSALFHGRELLAVQAMTLLQI